MPRAANWRDRMSDMGDRVLADFIAFLGSRADQYGNVSEFVRTHDEAREFLSLMLAEPKASEFDPAEPDSGRDGGGAIPALEAPMTEREAWREAHDRAWDVRLRLGDAVAELDSVLRSLRVLSWRHHSDSAPQRQCRDSKSRARGLGERC